MNILKEYTLDYVRRNKKSSIAIMIALFIATLLISGMGIFFYNLWADNVRLILKEQGHWHGELYDTTWGKDLDYVKSYASVDEVMVKGQWYVAEIEDAKRPYLIMRNADKAYWNAMPEQYGIIEGRIPTRAGEIAVSKQFMEAYPEYVVGDSITLPTGHRMKDGACLDPISVHIDKEVFKAEKEVTYTICGVLDITTPSSVPAYTGIGYLDHEEILPEDQIVVYIRFKNMRDTYEELPKIAEGIGYEKDEYGEYLLRYNTQLLSKYFISPKTDEGMSQQGLANFVVYFGSAVVAVGVFVFIIHNAFEISMNSRKKQLGMFKSIGATPHQIKASIIFEAILLAIIPIVLGVIVSKGIWYWFVGRINEVNGQFEDELMAYHSSWWVDGIVIGLVLLIAWLSAYIPSRKINRKMPIEILREEFTNKAFSSYGKNVKRRNKRKRSSKNIYAELATNHFKANKKAFRTSLISITLSFALFMVTLTGIASGNLMNDIYYREELKNNITLDILDGRPIELRLHEAMSRNKKINSFMELNKIMATTWITNEEESVALKEIGGLETIVQANQYNVIKKDNQYRIMTNIMALDDESFKAYCNQIGVDWKPYYDETGIKSIIYNQVKDTFHSTIRNRVDIEFLNLKKGHKLKVSEKIYDDDLGKGEVEIEVGAVTNELPPFDMNIGNYMLTQIMPASSYQKMLETWSDERTVKAMFMQVQIQVEEPDITEVCNWLKDECDKLYGSGDYYTWDQVEADEADRTREQISMLMVSFITGLIALVGMSNAFCTVYTSLDQRSRSFAILRSVGVSPKGIHKLLRYEAISFAIKPIIYASAIEIIWMVILIKIDESNWTEFSRYVPFHAFSVFAMAIILSVVIAYFIGSYKIRRENIVEAIKCENI